MKLLCIFATLLAISLAEEIKEEDSLDLDAEASVELLRTDRADKEALDSSASAYSSNNNYIPPSQRPPRPWNQNYIPNVPQNTWNNPAQVYPPILNNPSQSNYIPNTPVNPQNDYVPQNNYQPSIPQNTNYPSVPQNQNYQPSLPQNQNYQPSIPQNQNYQPSVPQNQNYQPSVPQNNYQPTVPQNNLIAPSNPAPPSYNPTNPQTPQNDYYNPQNTWTSTQAVPVIKNEQFFGENGNYKYEYQIGDGTHVGEEGYLVNPNTDNESIVKRGWYSYVGGDGRVYTVKWWADDSGYHAFGDHLPTPPPVPPAIQAALDQAAKDEANKVQPTQPANYYPQPTQPTNYYPRPTPPPTYYPTQPSYYPNNNYNNNYYNQG